MQRVHTGTWGGPHIRIEVGSGSATIEYDCANGTINGPLMFDSKGRFTWTGSHRRERPGPVRRDDNDQGRPASYSGSIKGDTMTLSVKGTDTGDDIGTYTLTRGASGRVFKCK